MRGKIIAASLLLSLLIGSCLKKGEDDPFVSLRTRKARITGEWKMTGLLITTTDSSGTETLTSDGSTYNASAGNTLSGPYTWNLTINKDGTYNWTRVIDAVTETSSGTWNFTQGVGKLKNKSQIAFFENNYSSSSGTTFTASGNYTDMAYDLKELRNKKMVWEVKISQTDSYGTTSSDETCTWEAK